MSPAMVREVNLNFKCYEQLNFKAGLNLNTADRRSCDEILLLSAANKKRDSACDSAIISSIIYHHI
ncbi:hypothetical protein [uncultured Campylobacter sp.]|uniref:hypothetical protein n=1 Tax=uncultured Campylobacter sp. TaxID=218934 RepID=UPI002602DC8C|nr:hypothetical protein [uncultured Campylobacter sp.]